METCQELSAILSSIHQENLAADLSEEQQRNMLEDLKKFNSVYHGGIVEYTDKVKKLLHESGSTSARFVGIDVPNGVDLNMESDEFEMIEGVGEEALSACCFAIVGGGIGERLNSKKAKLCLTFSPLTGQTFLGYYFSIFHAIEEKFHTTVPVAIMTSSGTHSQILEELEANNYYGLDKDHVTLMPQIEVPAVRDADSSLAVKEDGHLTFKPHGHGDIHTLLYRNNLIEKWSNMGKKHIIFMQDTNILAPFSFPALLGAACTNSLDFCSMGIVRRPGEKVGSISRLTDVDGNVMTCNIEYNEFEGLLQRITGHGDEVNQNGNSSYPGNINILYVRIESYSKTLESSHGVIPEFINPKYADASHTRFLSPSRLECMMQDLPKLMGKKLAVGYCSLPRWQCFSAVKNSKENAILQEQKTGFPESFFSMEEDFFKFFRRVARAAGVQVGDAVWDESTTPAFGVPHLPILLISPKAALTVTGMKKLFGSNVVINPNSIVMMDSSDAFIENATISGVVHVDSPLRDATIENTCWTLTPTEERYTVVKSEIASF